jgi:hypothetical protein
VKGIELQDGRLQTKEKEQTSHAGSAEDLSLSDSVILLEGNENVERYALADRS